MPQISIGPEFFAKAKNDYNDWHWAIVREFNQNGMDCGSKNIRWTVELRDGKTVVTVENDGKPMTEDILVGKLLSLGSSGKDEREGNTGGFGKAKEILYFCHESYEIHTGDLCVQGSGGSYDLVDNGSLYGTRSVVTIDGDYVYELKQAFDTFVFYGQWSGTFWWNGEPYTASMKKGAPRRDLGFGMIYTNKSAEYRLVVRINGQPMFIKRCGLDRCVVIELSEDSLDCLQSNRDSLKWFKRQELDTFITELSVDKKSALKPRQQRYRHYDGSRLCHRSAENVSATAILQLDESPKSEVAPVEDVIDLVDGDEEVTIGTAGVHEERSDRPGMKAAAYRPMPQVEEVRVAVSEEFVIKNETDLVVPTYYRPDERDFSSYAKKLAKIWGRLMLQMHRTFDHEADFAIGFLFSEDSEAQFEDGDFGKCYLISPAALTEQRLSSSKSWKKRFALTERNRVLAIAAHEFVHGLGYDIHDEDYASKLTDVMAVVMDNRKDFNWAWK
jgi:hypothetical protein